ncbi:MAG: DUF4430 domain-containing protein [Solirubrobacteraceae bacterium]|nr:DUF4430 domain-containing protein [Solirubrobacteraceae bacterium]
MARSLSRLLAGGLLLLLALAAPAGAQAPSLTVRVEGDADTLLAQTTVPASGDPVTRGGNTCDGDSALAALDRATGGAWAGTWNAGFGDWEVTEIRGEVHSFSAPSYWSFFRNERPADLGVCGQKVQSGDRLLFAPAPSNFSPVGVLSLSAPDGVRPGVPFTVLVTRTTTTFDPPDYTATTVSAPAGGAAISLPGGITVMTGADGKAQVTLTAGGPVALRASHSGDVRSAAVATCVSDGADGFCGSVRPAPPVDREAPVARISASLAEKRVFRRGRGPRRLAGAVAADPSGIRDVRLRLTRRVPPVKSGKRRCTHYHEVRERWVRSGTCGVEGGRWFSVGDRASWSYLLPGRLGPGRYVLDVRVVDGAGNATAIGRRSSDGGAPRDRVIFYVR